MYKRQISTTKYTGPPGLKNITYMKNESKSKNDFNGDMFWSMHSSDGETQLTRAAHNIIVIVLVLFTIFIAISVVCNILDCNIFGHQLIDCNICHHQYISCNILCHQYIILIAISRSSIYCNAILRAVNIILISISVYCIAICFVINLFISILQYIVLYGQTNTG
jgi:hypothetical protein